MCMFSLPIFSFEVVPVSALYLDIFVDFDNGQPTGVKNDKIEDYSIFFRLFHFYSHLTDITE